MQRIALRNEDERTAPDSGAGAERRVILVFPASVTEYEQARVEVKASPRPPVETKPADRDEDVTPAGGDGAATAETPGDGYYVVTSDSQRRAWGLPDLVNETAAHGSAPRDADTIERHDRVPVVNPAEAIDLLFENGENESDDQDSDGVAIGARRCGRTHPAPVVNLKHDRGPIPDHIRATFRELCGQSRIDGLLESVDKLIATLEGSVVSDLEAARTEVAALRRQEVSRERLGDAGGADPEDEQADRVARTCWAIERRLRKVDEALERLDFSGMKIWPTPSSFRRLLREAEDDPAENAPSEGLSTACDKALRGFEQAAEQAIGGIRTIVDARRDVAPGDWNDAALRQIRHVLARIEDARKMLGSDSLPKDEVEALREGLQAIEEERPSADQSAATTQEVLERLETADLPVPVLARALDEVRMAQTAGREAAAVLLERLQVVADLPWTARAAERVDIEAAMAELEAAHAGRAALKARIRRFLATRWLTSTTWTVEGLSHGARFCRGEGSAPVALRRLVVRPARPATRAPILCFAGPPGCGKTSLAKLIARALRRPAVTVALGGVWDESAIRGLPISFRSPEAGRIVCGLREAKVRNPVMILDEIDKVGEATKNFGDPSAALLELLDPEQNTRFRDVYLDVPVDVSEVLFIATANDLARIPAPLRDRLEIIEAPGYTDDEKIDIVRRTLWGEQLEVSGLNAGAFWTQTAALTHLERPEGASGASPVRRRLAVEVLDEATSAVMQPGAGPAASGAPSPMAGSVAVTDAAIREVVRGHTCEAGVRELARQLGGICQFLALRRVEAADTAPITVVADADEDSRVDPARRRFTVAEILGPPRFDSLPDRVRDALSRERDRVLGLHSADPEAIAAQAWIEAVEGIPWRRAEERLDAPAPLRRTLDREHVGRAREKDQALDYLVARQTAAERHAAGSHVGAATILCLCGPTGIGRAAFAQALAVALGRRFVRVSLAGAEKPAAIHGVARPAPDATPGRLVDALGRLGPLPGRAGDNPLVLLGELDLLGEAAADALLGALDPAGNRAFRDRYVGLPLDLAGVLFVAAATNPGRIPPLLRERLELLPLAGYADAEKERIAASYLIPQRRGQHGLSGEDLSCSPAALRLLIDGYAREPGVRVLGHRIDALCRRAVRLRAEGLPLPGEMGPETVAAWLGAPPFRDEEIAARSRRPGVAVGLAATPEGGGVLVIEVNRLPGRGSLRVTGTVGAMMKESVAVALTWVRSHSDRFPGVAARFDDATDVHVHVDDAGHSKDGPSAGVTFAAALISALAGQPVRGDVAMSGELTLAGTVEPVASIREKVLAACRAGMTAVILPMANKADVTDIFGDELPCHFTIHYARTMDDVLEVVLRDIVV